MNRERHPNLDLVTGGLVSEDLFEGTVLEGHARFFKLGRIVGHPNGALNLSTDQKSLEEEYIVQRFLRELHSNVRLEGLKIREPKHPREPLDMWFKEGISVTATNKEGEEILHNLAKTLESLGFDWKDKENSLSKI